MTICLVKVSLQPPTAVKLYKLVKNKFVLIKQFDSASQQFELDLDYCPLFLILVTNLAQPTVQLLAIFRAQPHVKVDERTTVASIFTFANFIHLCPCSDLIVKISPDLAKIAYGMKLNFVGDCGQISPVIASNPNDLETNSYPLFNYLANLLFYAITDPEVRAQLFQLTDSKSTIGTILSIAKQPFNKVKQIYRLIEQRKPLFQPALNELKLPPGKSPIPNQWTLTLKFNRNGSQNFIIGGPGLLAFDQKDRVWINNNVRQGTPNSSTFCTILKSNGRPANFSPLFGGGLLGAGFGIASTGQKIAIGNFGWGSTDYNPQQGSVTLINFKGQLLSPANGFTTNVRRAQGMCFDQDGNLWIASWGSQEPLGSSADSTFDFPDKNSAVTVYIGGDPDKSDIFEFDNPFFATFDVAVDQKGQVYASNAGNLTHNVPSSIFKFRLVQNKIKKLRSWVSPNGFEAFRQVKVSPNGFIYVAAVATSRVIKLDSKLNFVQAFTNKIDGPWGIEFDRSRTMFVANFRRDTATASSSTLDLLGPFGVTIIRNDDEATAQLATLPTGGQEVILANGFPLYGSNNRPSFEPLMRLTGSRLDRVGNLWAVNNWKPALLNNVTGNPGGDGVVVFISLGQPSKKRFNKK